MNEIAVNGDKRMTVKEISDILEVPLRTVHAALDRVLPGIKVNGKTTYLNEEQITILAMELKRAHNTDLASTRKVATTDLEMIRKSYEVLQWMAGQIDAKDARIAELEPKAACAEALMSSDTTMSITNASKHFGLHPRTQVLPYLMTHGYLTTRGLPTQAAIDADYLTLRERRCNDEKVRPCAVVEARQLEVWRTRVVPQIKKAEAQK